MRILYPVLFVVVLFNVAPIVFSSFLAIVPAEVNSLTCIPNSGAAVSFLPVLASRAIITLSPPLLIN